jgi:Uma2 family endonuclease
MGNPVKTEPRMNAEAFLAWYDLQPDGYRYELLDGIVNATHAPNMQGERVIHAETKARVTQSFRNQIHAKRLQCQALGDGMAVRVDDDTVFEPDAMVRCGPRLPDDDLVVSDAIIVVEVASPSTQGADALFKFARYFRNLQITHYLIVLPRRASVLHHRRHADGRIETMSYESGQIALEPPGLILDVDALFADA